MLQAMVAKDSENKRFLRRCVCCEENGKCPVLLVLDINNEICKGTLQEDNKLV